MSDARTLAEERVRVVTERDRYREALLEIEALATVETTVINTIVLKALHPEASPTSPPRDAPADRGPIADLLRAQRLGLAPLPTREAPASDVPTKDGEE